MREDVQRELISRFRSLRSRRATDLADRSVLYPAAEYTSNTQLAEERAKLFRGGPIVVALTADVPHSGDFLATRADGTPLLVGRGTDEKVRVFLNACRHRGAAVATGRGTADRVFTCPYHAWSYRLDGTLHRRPLAGEYFDGDARDGRDLIEVPSDETAGLIFTRLDGSGPVEGDEWLGGLADDFESYGLDGFQHVETRSQTRDMNWKMVVDSFLEAYHLFSLHKNSIAPLYFSETALFDEYSTTSLFDSFGPHFRFVGLRRSIEALGDDPAGWDLLPHATIHHVVFPNTLVVHQVDHIQVWRVFPDGEDPGRSVIETSAYAPNRPAPDRDLARCVKNLDILLDVTNSEDFPLLEGVQRAMATGACRDVVFGRNEAALVHFHDAIRRALA